MLAGSTPAEARRELETEYRASSERAELAVDCAQASLAVDRKLEKSQVSLYIGIPFCPTRCAYCSFVSADVGRTLKLVEPYLEGVLSELAETGRVLRRAGQPFLCDAFCPQRKQIKIYRSNARRRYHHQAVSPSPAFWRRSSIASCLGGRWSIRFSSK